MGVSQKGTPRGYRGIIRGLYRALRDYIEVILRNTQMVCSVRRGGGRVPKFGILGSILGSPYSGKLPKEQLTRIMLNRDSVDQDWS